MQSLEAPETKLDRLASKVLDRQLRLYGKGLQEKLMNSTVLVSGLTGANTELAKNIVLTAINLDIDDSNEVTDDTLTSNFLFGPQHLGQLKSDAAVAVLAAMNPLVKIKSVANPSTSSPHSAASLTVLPLQPTLTQEPSSYFLTLGLGLSAVAFLHPRADSPSFKRSLELMASGRVELPAELCAVLLACGSDLTPAQLAATDDLMLLNLLGNAKVQQAAEDVPAKIKRLLGDWQADCGPVYSVLGSILSQEAVTFFKDSALVASGWLVFDGLAGIASIVSVTEQTNITAQN